MTYLLTAYTIPELEAAAPAEEVFPPAPPTPRLKLDQADLFAEQGTLFGHVQQPGEMKCHEWRPASDAPPQPTGY